MTDQVQDDVVEVTQDDQDLEAGYNQAIGKAPAEKPAPDAAPETAQPAQAATPAEEPQPVSWTEAQFNEEVERRVAPIKSAVQDEFRKIHGKIGEVIRSIQQQQAAGKPAARKFTAEMFKKLNEELPGLGSAFAADLTEIFGQAAENTATADAQAQAQGVAFDPKAFFTEQVAPQLSQMQAAIERRAEERLLRSQHPDYKSVVYADPNAEKPVWNPEFEAWVKTQPAEKQLQIQESEDAVQISGFVKEFKEYRAAQKKQKDDSKKRLEQAITPKGNREAPSQKSHDEDAEFEAGFKKVAGQR